MKKSSVITVVITLLIIVLATLLCVFLFRKNPSVDEVIESSSTSVPSTSTYVDNTPIQPSAEDLPSTYYDDDSTGGLQEKPEGFIFQFTNQAEFESAVDSSVVSLLCNTDNALLFDGEWTFIGVDGDFIIVQRDDGEKYQMEIFDDSVFMSSYFE